MMTVGKLSIARPGKVEISTLADLMSRIRRSNYSSAHPDNLKTPQIWPRLYHFLTILHSGTGLAPQRNYYGRFV